MTPPIIKNFQYFEKLQTQKIAPRCQGTLGQEKSLEISVFLAGVDFPLGDDGS
jgi:hypothetical protein